MDPITQEIEQMADRLEKSNKTEEFSIDLIKSTVLQLGIEGLKKATINLNDQQKELLKSILETMKKSKAVESAETVKDGEAKANEKKKMTADDEKVAKEAENKGMAEIEHQGDRPEGLPGQVIKGETAAVDDLIKGGSGSGRKQENPALAGLESVKQMAERSKESEDVESKFEEAPKAKKEKKMPGKELVKSVIVKMQEQKLEKGACISKLSKSLGKDEAKLGALWDLMAKGDKLPEKGNPEGNQSDVPEHMKDGKKVAKKTPESGEPSNNADEGEMPPSTMKKSDDNFFHVEEEMYLAKSSNPFATRTVGRGINYKVDEYIDLEAASQKQRLAKSTFDYADTEVLAKSEPDPTQAVIDANAKQKADAAREDAEEIRNIKTNEKLTRIEGQGQKMPMLKSSYVNDLIAKGLDMDQGTLEEAVAVRDDAATKDVFFVKSFDDSDLDAAFNTQDMWDDTGKKSDAVLEKAGGPGSRGGKVIGHTRSGKPIYSHVNHAEHASFTAEDHDDAVEHHVAAQGPLNHKIQSIERDKMSGAARGTRGYDHSGQVNAIDQRNHHKDMAKRHDDAAYDLRNKKD